MSKTLVPWTPGATVRREVLEQLGLRQADLARAMGVSTVRVNQIVNGRAPITPEMAVRLGHATNSPPEYWAGLQCRFDLEQAKLRLAEELTVLPSATRGGRQDRL